MSVEAEELVYGFKQSLFSELFRDCFEKFVQREVYRFTADSRSPYQKIYQSWFEDTLGALDSTLFLVLPGSSVELPYNAFLPQHLSLTDANNLTQYFSEDWTEKVGIYRHWPFLSYLLEKRQGKVVSDQNPYPGPKKIVILTPDFGKDHFNRDCLSLMNHGVEFLCDLNKVFFVNFIDALKGRMKKLQIQHEMQLEISWVASMYNGCGLFTPVAFTFNRANEYAEYVLAENDDDATCVADAVRDITKAVRRTFLSAPK